MNNKYVIRITSGPDVNKYIKLYDNMDYNVVENIDNATKFDNEELADEARFEYDIEEVINLDNSCSPTIVHKIEV